MGEASDEFHGRSPYLPLRKTHVGSAGDQVVFVHTPCVPALTPDTPSATKARSTQ